MIAPPMGDPVSPAKAEIVKTVPVRTPMSRMGESLAHSTGVRLMPAPEVTPKSAAKRMMGAFPVEGSQRPRMMIDVEAPMTIITLKCPTLSAIALGTVRPKRLNGYQLIPIISGAGVRLPYLVAFRMQTTYCARWGDMPWTVASATMNVNGMNMPPVRNVSVVYDMSAFEQHTVVEKDCHSP